MEMDVLKTRCASLQARCSALEAAATKSSEDAMNSMMALRAKLSSSEINYEEQRHLTSGLEGRISSMTVQMSVKVSELEAAVQRTKELEALLSAARDEIKALTARETAVATELRDLREIERHLRDKLIAMEKEKATTAVAAEVKHRAEEENALESSHAESAAASSGERRVRPSPRVRARALHPSPAAMTQDDDQRRHHRDDLSALSPSSLCDVILNELKRREAAAALRTSNRREQRRPSLPIDPWELLMLHAGASRLRNGRYPRSSHDTVPFFYGSPTSGSGCLVHFCHYAFCSC